MDIQRISNNYLHNTSYLPFKLYILFHNGVKMCDTMMTLQAHRSKRIFTKFRFRILLFSSRLLHIFYVNELGIHTFQEYKDFSPAVGER